jgi:hypothetical protein
MLDGVKDNSLKVHNCSEDALKCYRRYAKFIGGIIRGSRLIEWDVEGEKVVELLSKPCRFGQVLRKGKASDKGGKRLRVRVGRAVFVEGMARWM